MRTTLSIIICKLITKLCKLVGPIFKKEGSVLPGRLVLKMHKDVLKDIKYPRQVVVVTGSSGKGSTVSLIAHILSRAGKSVVWNKNGSNINSAIVTLVLNNARAWSREMDADVLLLELDERFVEGTLPEGVITHMALTNITRDQPARNVHPEVILDRLLASVEEGMHLIINADDPFLMRFPFRHRGRVTTYGVAKVKGESALSPLYAVDGAYCPSCHSKLKYTSYHYGHLGLYKCPKCSFGRGKVTYEAQDVDLQKGTFKIGDDEITLNKNVFFAVYYTLLAYTVCSCLDVPKTDILKALNENKMDSKRGKIEHYKERKIEMLESKNENALSYLQSISYIKNAPGIKTVIMGFENVSRRYKYNDLSWLWDVHYEGLLDDSVDAVILIGRFAWDVYTRLIYAGFDPSKLRVVLDVENLFAEVDETQGDIYTMVCFDMTAIIKSELRRYQNEKEN